MSRLVVDASVAVKMLIDEADSDQATALYRAHDLIAPDLLVSECANILWKKARRGELSASEAQVASRALAGSAIDLRPMRDLTDSATRLALRLDHPAYDCFYLALAAREDCVFVTADERLVRKVEQAGEGPEVRLLSSFAA